MLVPILFLLLGVLLFLLLWTIAGLHLSKHAFDLRFVGGGDYFPYYSSRHPGWQRQEISFPNNRGDVLRGFVFSYPDIVPKALLVLYHGYGMGLDDYLPECAYFSRRGYLVLAFDGSGTGHSDGRLYGLPQHILDLQACLNYVCADGRLSQLPLLLYGHSWGGYACNALGALADFPVRGIVSAAGFATATSALSAHVKRHYGLFSPFAMLGVHLYQRLCYGRLSGLTAMDGLKKYTCPVLIAQSDDDSIIPYSDNYGVLYRAFSTDPNKTFLPLTGHNHNLTTPAEIDRKKRSMLKQLRSDSVPAALAEEMNELKTHVDEDLLGQFADFLDHCLTQ